MNENDKCAYAKLVDEFATAKVGKDYAASDAARKKLLNWQDGFWSDDDYVKMKAENKYKYHDFFAPMRNRHD